MNLKKKLIFLILVSLCVLGLIFQMGINLTLYPSMKEQKEFFFKEENKKILRALEIEEEDINILCDGWATSDGLISEMRLHPIELKKDVLPDDMFRHQLMDFVVILNMKDEILFYKNHRPDIGFLDIKNLDIREELTELMSDVKWLGRTNATINTTYGPIMVAANPILDRVNLNRMEGIVILGRYIDDRMIEKISFYTMKEMKIMAFEQDELVDFHKNTMKGKNVFFSENKNKISVYVLLKDINKVPALMLHTESDTKLFSIVKGQIYTFVIINACLLILLGVLLYFSIEQYIVKRILHISGRMSRIEGLEDLSIRISNDNNNDEVSLLISSINLTLDRLEQEKVNRESAEKSMIKQEKLASIGRLTSSIAHEVNNPLMAIGNSLQVVKKLTRRRTGKNAPLLSEALDITESEVERIKIIISALLDFHRMDKEEFSKVSLKDTVQQSLAILKWSKKLKEVELITEIEEECFIMGAPVRLKQVFINFILNAAEALGDEGGRLHLLGVHSADKKSCEIHFFDNGPGLADEVKGHLFEPFVTTKEDKGVGLGLHISYKIIKNHYGDVIYDEDYALGTHFIIKLPRFIEGNGIKKINDINEESLPENLTPGNEE
ncbi:MAG: hypothetical protein GY757_58555 [bacterium]|nr:hypothetical protein [bacterium]